MTLKPATTNITRITITGTVQGVGFRPYVWRIATEMGLKGEVCNSANGVEVLLTSVNFENKTLLTHFVDRLKAECPPLAHIEEIKTEPLERWQEEAALQSFTIRKSKAGAMKTRITPDAATCKACLAEINDPNERRYHYPFANCTHCGPRLTIIHEAPYDRASTSMAGFPLCTSCEQEYQDPSDRRFHAQPIACPVCGPEISLLQLAGTPTPQPRGEEALTASIKLLSQDKILALKGLGGFHLACRALNGDLVAELRRRKQRSKKAFALMFRDLKTARQFCDINKEEATILESPAAPIVLIEKGALSIPESVAPGLSEIGIMLPSTPLHHLLMAPFEEPLVMTSGNLSNHPQFIENETAIKGLEGIADYALVHNRDITTRVDDSVARVSGETTTLLRRARGFAPAPISLPKGFEKAPDLIAYGSELKATFTLLKDGAAITSQHLGDLENMPTFEAYQNAIALYTDLFDHQPTARAVDAHPDYLSAKYGRELNEEEAMPLIEVQHHHAHMAAALGENRIPNDDHKHLGLILDGVGYGEDGTIWGGEFFYGNYKAVTRIGAFPAIPLPGAASAVKEPWRNLVAHIEAALGWEEFEEAYSGLELYEYLNSKPTDTLHAMMAKGLNSPKASSCGRLFDAVAAALMISPDEVTYEGEAAMRMEALSTNSALQWGEITSGDPATFPINLIEKNGRLELDFAPLWRGIFDDIKRAVTKADIAAKFHQSLALGLSHLVLEAMSKLPERPQQIAISGGCLQNKTLKSALTKLLGEAGLKVHNNNKLPANDGGISFGQALIAAAKLMSD